MAEDAIWVFTVGDPKPDVVEAMERWTRHGQPWICIPIEDVAGGAFRDPSAGMYVSQ